MSHQRSSLRRFVLAGLLCAGLLPLATTVSAAPEGQVRTEIVNSTVDGRPIHITYFPYAPKAPQPGGSENAPVLMLLHGKGGDRLVWEQKGAGNTGASLAAYLQDLGYAVVTVDMRKHGESKTADEQDAALRANDYTAMLGDLEAVKNFLLTEHADKKLNIGKLGIIAADDMAPVAATWTQLDWQKKPYDDAPVTDPAARTPRGQDVRALVLLSPSQTAGSMNILGPMKALRDPRVGLAVLVIYGTEDPDDQGISKRVFQNMSGNPKNKDRILLKDYKVKFRGTDLTAKDILVEVPILQFLDQHLMKLDVEWRDRRSRLQR